MKQEDIQEEDQLNRESYDFKENLNKLFALLLEIDKRINPHLYDYDSEDGDINIRN